MTADPARDPFELCIEVHPEDIDLIGHVNNLVYLRWVQDAAVAHWRAAATPEEQAKLLWVIVRQEIDYLRPALDGDEIIARTWVGGATRRSFERHTELLRAGDRKLLARARTIWCPIDAETHRVTDIDAETRERFSVVDAQAKQQQQ